MLSSNIPRNTQEKTPGTIYIGVEIRDGYQVFIFFHGRSIILHIPITLVVLIRCRREGEVQ
jgi:hypothetical protein